MADEDGAHRDDVTTPEALLAGLRAGGQAASGTRARLAHTAGDDTRASARAELAKLLARSLRPTDAPLVRWLLEQEIADLRAAGHGEREALYILIAALARFGQPADALLIWRAREATPQTRAGVDVEQLVRAGVEPVRRSLGSVAAGGGSAAREAAAALAWLEEGLASGALADLPGYFAWADERFGLHVSGPT